MRLGIAKDSDSGDIRGVSNFERSLKGLSDRQRCGNSQRGWSCLAERQSRELWER